MWLNLLTLLGFTILTLGLFLDGWAHNHILKIDTFFTPYHGLLYGGFFFTAAVLYLSAFKNYLRKKSFSNLLPPGYNLSLIGCFFFFLAGIGDLIWHTLFGIEVNVEALLSPTHLLLVTSGIIIVAAPIRRALLSSFPQRFLPAISVLLTTSYIYAALAFFTQYANPFVFPWPAATSEVFLHFEGQYAQSLGITSIILQSGLLMGFYLFLLKSFKNLPYGSLTLVLGLNVLMVSFLRDQYRFIPIAILTGFLADNLNILINPLASRNFNLRIFAFLVPVILYSLYYFTLLLTDYVIWSVHLWTGSIFLAGISGLLISYLVVPTYQKTN